MAGEKTTLQLEIQKDPGYFSRTISAFLVSGPTLDGQIQIEFGEDHSETTSLSITGALVEGSDPPTYQTTSTDIETRPVRVTFGRVKMNLLVAEQLKDLLEKHIAQAKMMPTGG